MVAPFTCLLCLLTTAGTSTAGSRLRGDTSWPDRQTDSSEEDAAGNGSSVDLFNSRGSKKTETVSGLGLGTQASTDSSSSVLCSSAADTSAFSGKSKRGSSLELFASSGEQEEGSAPVQTSSMKKVGSTNEELDFCGTRISTRKHLIAPRLASLVFVKFYYSDVKLVCTPFCRSYSLGNILRQVAYWPVGKEKRCFLGCKWLATLG